MLTLLNYIIIGLTALGTAFLSAFFFLGGPEEHELLRNNILSNLIGRTIFFAVPGLIISAFVITVNHLIKRTTTSDRESIQPIRIGLYSLIILVTASFVGSLIFFLG